MNESNELPVAGIPCPQNFFRVVTPGVYTRPLDVRGTALRVGFLQWDWVTLRGFQFLYTANTCPVVLDALRTVPLYTVLNK